MRIKITILFVFAFLFSMLSIFIKNDYSPLNMLWLRIVYSVCALLLVFVLILNYKKFLILWNPENIQQKMNFIAFSSFCIVPLIMAAGRGFVW
jgi:drug/metabolite transporter (DMT)-like permease